MCAKICSPHSQCVSVTVRSPWSPYTPRKISTQHDSLYLVLNFHLLSSRRTRVNWFLAFPSCSWAVYTPLSSSQKFWIISSTRPFSLTKFILCVCIKQSKYNKLSIFPRLDSGTASSPTLRFKTALLCVCLYPFPSSPRYKEPVHSDILYPEIHLLFVYVLGHNRTAQSKTFLQDSFCYNHVTQCLLSCCVLQTAQITRISVIFSTMKAVHINTYLGHVIACLGSNK